MNRRGFLTAQAAAPVAALALGSIAATPARAADPQPAGFAPVVAKLLPTVVSVYVRAVGQKTGGSASSGKTQYASQQSQGSGYFIDPSGYIVTNHHVIQNAYEITVVLEDQRQLRARLVANSDRIDVALLKVESSRPLPAVTFADSDLVKPGDAVLAVGNPLGLGGTVTSGIVSALNRNISETPYDDFIQIDAAINHGNSGGPLFNAAGELIGMNTAFFSAAGSTGSVGLGFAIPTNDIAWVIDQIRTRGQLNPGWIDVQVQLVSDEIAEAFGRPGPGGAIVVTTTPGSAVAKAGLQQADIIIGFNASPVADVRALARAVARTVPGTTAPMVVWRGRQEVTLQMPVAAWHGTDAINGIPPALHDANVALGLKAPHFGLNLVPLTSTLRQEWGMQASQQGVLINSVVPFSVADNHNLRPGEVIMSVMDTPVTVPAEAVRLVGALHDQGARYVAFLVGNDNGTRWVSMPIAAGEA